jgi:ABC-type dipeptide/oligopeptide/nickel transport system ATPase subunit
MSKSIIECIALSKQYKRKRLTIDAVKDVSLQIEKGEFVLLKEDRYRQSTCYILLED